MDTPRKPIWALQHPNTPPLSLEDDDHKTRDLPHRNMRNRSVECTPPDSPTPSQPRVGQHLAGSWPDPSLREVQNIGLNIQSVDWLPHNLIRTVNRLPPYPTKCSFDVEILKDEIGQDAIFGTGAWSTVYKAVIKPAPFRNSPLTPPSSPNLKSPTLVAVKRPSGKPANEIVTNEGLVLTHLSSFRDYDSHIVHFYGTISSTTSLVLAALPLSLDGHIKECARTAPFKGRDTRSEPIIGSSKTWLHLASQLINTLAWLHTEARVVHGDIKPANILLSPISDDDNTASETFPFRPLLVDFSSAHLLDSDEITPNTLSALTREYAAPELLCSKVLLNPLSTATPASDVFSLAVTLLVAVVGDTTVYDPNYSVAQRQAMATQGWNVLQFVRNGGECARAPKGGVVEQVLEQAVRKIDAADHNRRRIDATQWKELVEKMSFDGKSKESHDIFA